MFTTTKRRTPDVEVAEFGEACRAELLGSGGLDFADRLADHAPPPCRVG
jgi:hypothetical protein